MEDSADEPDDTELENAILDITADEAPSTALDYILEGTEELRLDDELALELLSSPPQATNASANAASEI